MRRRVIRCTLSGSFHKDRDGLLAAYDELIATGCQVLSPHWLDFDDENTLFVRDEAEKSLSEETIERHHLLAISQSISYGFMRQTAISAQALHLR